jgi:cholesterol oxidase
MTDTSPSTNNLNNNGAFTQRRTRSLSKGMVDLVVELNTRPETVFDVVIVGSGYGGSVAAQQLAGLQKLDKDGKASNISVCVLERGSEYLPGMFPSALADLPGHVRYGAQATGTVTGNHEGLFDVRLGEDVNALVANGLGGGSLINAGVMLEPDFNSFKSDLPPALISALTTGNAGEYLLKAKRLLLNEPLSLSPVLKNTFALQSFIPSKFERLKDLSEGVQKPDKCNKSNSNTGAEFAEITIAMQDTTANLYGIRLEKCNGCGDCMTGCNVGAKASLNTNLLAQAKRDQVRIYTGASVLSIKRSEQNTNPAVTENVWELEVVHTSPSLRAREAKVGDLNAGELPVIIKAKKVILAAGTFGSTEILLRSRSAKLGFSNKLGERFSCNGDNIAAIYDTKKPANCSADEHVALQNRNVGPTITGTIKVARKKDKDELGYLIQEFAIPAPLKRFFEEAVTTSDAITNLTKADKTRHGEEHTNKPAAIDPCAVNPTAIDNTLMLGLIGHDEAAGLLRLPVQNAQAGSRAAQEGALQIVWPEARNGKQVNAAFERLKEYSKNAFKHSNVIANPLWRLLPKELEVLISQPRGPVLTVHPLGGCTIGNDASKGVVDEYGCVFNAGKSAINKKDDWYGSLLVLDGSIIPGSLGVNPALTISAIALRAMDEFIKKLQSKKEIEIPNPSVSEPRQPLDERHRFSAARPSVTKEPVATKVAITERLSGKVRLRLDNRPPENYILELTLKYEERELRSLMRAWDERKLKVENGKNDEKSYLRIFHERDWDAYQLSLKDKNRLPKDNQNSLKLRVADEHAREMHAVWKAPLTGTLTFFHREPSCFLSRAKSLWAWFVNRGCRDITQKFEKFLQEISNQNLSRNTPRRGGCNTIFDAGKLSTRAGEVRLFDYDLTVQPSQRAFKNELTELFNQAFSNKEIKGNKRLTYNLRANPWQQLTQLTLTTLPAKYGRTKPKLTLDARFVAKQGIPLLEITAQENQANALLDMASFGLFMTRLLLNIHIWTFRKPDDAKDTKCERLPQRLPGSIAGLPEPEITELPVSLKDGRFNAVVRLTRYRGTNKNLHPIALIHGYSASGTTFTHPSLKVSAVAYLWKNSVQSVKDTKADRRDVWVIDLRTSAGMPTAIEPWSYEEVALTDIPAALLHIKNVTGQTVDVIAHCIGGAMLSMAVLTKAADVLDDTVELGVDTRLTEAQLGLLDAFNGVSAVPNDKPHPTINAIVLTQKGPFIRYTEGNIFRAYLMRTLRRWLLPNGFQFRPSKSPNAAEQVLDRLLSSIPYPKADYDVENPRWSLARTPWTASRHRLDALYAQVFSAKNISSKTLNCIDDFFGPLNIDTLAQTIHFVRFNSITNQRGRGEFVTLEKLRTRWRGIPTFAIHGGQNGLADVSTQELLETNFKAADIPFTRKTYPDLGHQDIYIGTSSEKVFHDIKYFFSSPHKKSAASTKPITSTPTQVSVDLRRIWRFDVPWVGPRIDGYETELKVHALSSPMYGAAILVLVPVKLSSSNSPNGKPSYSRIGSISKSKLGNSQYWMTLCLTIRADKNSNTQWLAIVAYAADQTTIDSAAIDSSDASTRKNFSNDAPLAVQIAQNKQLLPIGAGGNANDSTFTVKDFRSNMWRKFKSIWKPIDFPNSVVPKAVISTAEYGDFATQLDAWLAHSPQNLADALITSKDIDKWCASTEAAQFSFALASCQYPPGLLDKRLAEQSMTALEKKIETDGLDFAIFAGDQIYADATAGLLDPTRRDERLDLPYAAALSTKPMRNIMRQIPVHMLLDDHEIVDNWEPPHPSKGPETIEANKKRFDGLKAYWKYQRLRQGAKVTDCAVSYSFSHGCASVYMLDTRSQRQHRAIGKPELASMFLPNEIPNEIPEEMENLKAWLCDNKSRLKFIVSPSILLPRRLDMLNVGVDQATRSDAWDGYPAQMRWLFECIVDQGIDNTVFLSGDEHLCCMATAILTKKDKAPRTIASVHASGLYAPFPFANSKEEDFVDGSHCFDLPTSQSLVHCSTVATFAPAAARFAKISVQCTEGTSPQVQVEFCDANGAVCFKEFCFPMPRSSSR